MAQPTTTGYLILGLLSTRDWSAYDIVNQAGKGLSEVWPRADRQLYYAPKRLVEDGHATSRVEAVGRRNRTVYSITPAGRDALAAWLATESGPPALQFEGMVRVFFADQGSIEDLRRNLEVMIAHADESAALFARHAAYMLTHDGGSVPDHHHLTTLGNRFMIEHFQQISGWAKWALGVIETWPDTATPLRTHHDETVRILRENVAMVPDAEADPDADPDGDGTDP